LKLSIIIPCYNEEQTINQLLNSLFSVNFPIEREIIVVDDGSHKNHKEFLNEEIESNKIKVVSGVPYVTCPYCGTTFEITEEPKW